MEEYNSASEAAKKRLADAKERASLAAKALKLAKAAEKSAQKMLTIAQSNVVSSKESREAAETQHKTLAKEVDDAEKGIMKESKARINVAVKEECNEEGDDNDRNAQYAQAMNKSIYTKRQKTEQGTSLNTSSKSGQFDHGKSRRCIEELHLYEETNHEALLDFIVKKLSTQSGPFENEYDVMDEIQQMVNDDGAIPRELIPQAKKQNSLFMWPQGLYEPWVKAIAPFVLDLLKKFMIDESARPME